MRSRLGFANRLPPTSRNSLRRRRTISKPQAERRTENGRSSLAEISQLVDSLPEHIWIRFRDQEKIQQRLRVSLVDHCNYGCFFCHNESQGPIRIRPDKSLSINEIVTGVTAAVDEGVRYVKLTGGEPLLYGSSGAHAIALVEALNELRIKGAKFDLSMTTNGSLLQPQAQALKNAGLNRVTVSLTTGNTDIFTALIAKNSGLLKRSIAGLRAAYEVGLTPVKMNAVVYQSKISRVGNLSELYNLIRLGQESGVAEFRIFTLLWHKYFSQFAEYYHYFSKEMIAALTDTLRRLKLPDPSATVDVLANLGTLFSDRVYPKVEFGVQAQNIKLGFEAMKFGRLGGTAASQEGPYAIRLASDGGLRAALNTEPSYDFVDAIRSNARPEILRRLYRKEIGEML